MKLLHIREDAEECVSDTYQQAWEQIPPKRPDRLKAWLGQVVRNISINLWNKNHTQKRYGGVTVLLSELEECIPSGQSVEGMLEAQELGLVISGWLMSLSREERILFVRRYWYGVSLQELAAEWGIGAGKLAQRMYRLRQGLKLALEKEGIIL